MSDTMLLVGIVYAAVLVLLAIGLLRLPRSTPISGPLPRVSVIVACRNEEIDLPTCIRSIVALDYPVEKLEVFLVDDESTDATARIIARASAEHLHIHAMSTSGFTAGNLRAKARGVAAAARHATGDWLFITDADGELPPGWLRHMLGGVGPRDGVLGGLVTVKGNTLLGIAERVAWGYALPFAWGLGGWGAAMVCIGPNMAIRRDAYREGGGLENADFAIAEDLALVGIARRTGHGVRVHASPETTVALTPVPTLAHHFSQLRRWLAGGFEAPWYYRAGIVVMFGYHFALSLLLLGGWFASVNATLMLWLFKLVGDTALVGAEAWRLKRPSLLLLLPIIEVYTTLALLWLPLSFVVRPRVRWRGSGYTVAYDPKPRNSAAETGS